MNNLLSEKRYRLIALAAITAIVVGLIWYYWIYPRKSFLNTNAAEIRETQKKTLVAHNQAQLADSIKANLESAQEKLSTAEEKLPHGDVYNWMIGALDKFKAAHDITFSAFDPPQASELNPGSKLPYKGAAFTVSGTATYHAFGKFLADFENTFPQAKLRSLELEPAGVADLADDEANRIRFKMEFVTLVKSTAQPQ
jgi:Tfp pilus assembly protein PilO